MMIFVIVVVVMILVILMIVVVVVMVGLDEDESGPDVDGYIKYLSNISNLYAQYIWRPGLKVV